MNFPKNNQILSLYNLVLNKIKSLQYPEEILYNNYLGSNLCNKLIQQFRNTNHLLLKPYRYRYTEYFSIQDLTNNLIVNKPTLRSLKQLCFGVIYKKNIEVLNAFKEVPKTVKNDIISLISNRNTIYDSFEQKSSISLQQRKFVDKENTKQTFLKSSNYFTILRKIYHRKYININSFNTKDSFDLLKVSEPLLVNFKSKIKKTSLGLELNASIIYHFQNLEKYIKSMYYPNFSKSNLRFKSIKNDIITVDYIENDINSISGYKFLKDNCFQEDEYNVSLQVFIKERLNEISLYFKIDEILEIN